MFFESFEYFVDSKFVLFVEKKRKKTNNPLRKQRFGRHINKSKNENRPFKPDVHPLPVHGKAF